MRFAKAVVALAAAAALAAGCGAGARHLADGGWYGKLVSVDVKQRSIVFAPACGPNGSAVSRTPATIHLAAHPDLEIYFRPGGRAVAGHVQPVGLASLAQAPADIAPPDFPPGWYLIVQGGVATSVLEDSGQWSTDANFRCISSPNTQRFVSAGARHA